MELHSPLPTGQSTVDFKGRVDAVFGGLGTTTWSLAQTQVNRPGRDNLDSSEDEGEDQKTREVRAELDDFADDQEEKPSKAFCNALDTEEEYDAFDAVATESICYDTAEGPSGRPCLDTEVLEGNVWDVRCEELEARCSAEASQADGNGAVSTSINTWPDVEGVPTSTGTPSRCKRTTKGILADATRKPSKAKKVVRFTGLPEPVPLYVPPHLRQKQPPSCGGCAVDMDDTPASSSGVEAHGMRNRRLRSQRQSYVPDHVRNPQKYTCYTLDEGISVGSGRVNGTGGERENEQAALRAVADAERASQDVAVEEEQRHEAVFGGGIEFRPRASSCRGGGGGARAAGGASAAGPSRDACRLSLMEDDEKLEEEDGAQDMEGEAAGGAGMGATHDSTNIAFKTRKAKERKLRSRALPRAEEEEVVVEVYK